MLDTLRLIREKFLRGSFPMLEKLGSTVVPVYLSIISRIELFAALRTLYFRNSINERLVKTMLVESQSSIPVPKYSHF